MVDGLEALCFSITDDAVPDAPQGGMVDACRTRYGSSVPGADDGL